MREKTEAYHKFHAEGYAGKAYDPAEKHSDYRWGWQAGRNDKAVAVHRAKSIPPDLLAWFETNKSRMTARVANVIKVEIVEAKTPLLELLAMTDGEWLRCPNLGVKSLKDLREVIPWSGALDPIDVQAECARLLALSERLEANAKLLREVVDSMQARIEGER